uniref:CUB domain-containing protein n=1 Tax=Syphacia muris TaxID=451379 RepID=A0A0N5AHW0_9BILA
MRSLKLSVISLWLLFAISFLSINDGDASKSSARTGYSYRGKCGPKKNGFAISGKFAGQTGTFCYTFDHVSDSKISDEFQEFLLSYSSDSLQQFTSSAYLLDSDFVSTKVVGNNAVLTWKDVPASGLYFEIERLSFNDTGSLHFYANVTKIFTMEFDKKNLFFIIRDVHSKVFSYSTRYSKQYAAEQLKLKVHDRKLPESLSIVSYQYHLKIYFNKKHVCDISIRPFVFLNVIKLQGVSYNNVYARTFGQKLDTSMNINDICAKKYSGKAAFFSNVEEKKIFDDIVLSETHKEKAWDILTDILKPAPTSSKRSRMYTIALRIPEMSSQNRPGYFTYNMTINAISGFICKFPWTQGRSRRMSEQEAGDNAAVLDNSEVEEAFIESERNDNFDEDFGFERSAPEAITTEKADHLRRSRSAEVLLTESLNGLSNRVEWLQQTFAGDHSNPLLVEAIGTVVGTDNTVDAAGAGVNGDFSVSAGSSSDKAQNRHVILNSKNTLALKSGARSFGIDVDDGDEDDGDDNCDSCCAPFNNEIR